MMIDKREKKMHPCIFTSTKSQEDDVAPGQNMD